MDEEKKKWRLNRRAFLKGSAVVAGAALAGSILSWDREKELIGRVNAAESVNGGVTRYVRTICPYCSMGCGYHAKTENGVYVNQEPWHEHPINKGNLCGRGSAAIQAVTSEKRLRYPMKKSGGNWERVDWDTIMGEVSSRLLDIRDRYGSDSVMWLGSAKLSTEEAYMLRKLVAFWGTNNVDSQARYCHSPIHMGLGATLGFGAQTNNINDVENTRCAFFIGSNAAQTTPMVMRHLNAARENYDAPVIVADPRFTKTANMADEYIKHRPGTDIALVNGLINILLSNGWYDEDYVERCTHGLDQVRRAVADYSPVNVEGITGVPASQLERVARMLYENRPSTVICSSGLSQHSNGTQNVRAVTILQLLLGNVGKSGGGVNALCGQDNVQGAADMGLVSHTLPGYYGLEEDAWRYWASVWGVDYSWLVSRFDGADAMSRPGLTATRWHEAVLNPETVDQPEVKAVVLWGHSPGAISQLDRVRQALGKVELVVVVDPFVTSAAILSDRRDGVYLLPAATQQEGAGSVTNSSRQMQWRYQVVEPVFESRRDSEIMLDLAERFGFAKEYSGSWTSVPEDVTSEINRGVLSLGLRGRTVERIQLQMEHAGDFADSSARAIGGPLEGEYYGLPWPCWNTDHPGTPILYDMSKPVGEGGHAIPTQWGASAMDGKSMVSAASHPGGPNTGYPAEEGWKTDEDKINAAISSGRVPSGSGRARLWAWSLSDEVPRHREPIHTPRSELIAAYPTYPDAENFRVSTMFRSAQDPGMASQYPLVLITGRVVGQHGSGGFSLNSRWLCEFEPTPYVEIHPRTAVDLNVREGDMAWVEAPHGSIKMRVKTNEGIGEGAVFVPFHWHGWLNGERITDRYPGDLKPYSVGAPGNMVSNYGYDRETLAQEVKVGLCRVRRA